MNDWRQHLPDEEIFKIRTGLIQSGLVTDRYLDLWRNPLPPAYSGMLPGAGLPANDRLLAELMAMNKVRNLRNGDVPLAQWLQCAKAVAAELPVADELDKALLRLGDGVPEDATVGAADAASVAADIAPSLNTEITPEAMIGGFDDTLSVSYLRKGLAACRSVFKLLVHRHVDGQPVFGNGDTPVITNGTGWMIGPGLVITNHHVINARRKTIDPEPDASPEDFKLQAENVQILYDYIEKDQPSLTVGTVAGALVTADKDLDFAIIRVPDAAEKRPPLSLRTHVLRKTLAQALGTQVNVLQHPNGDPMRIGFRDSFVTIGNETILGHLSDTSYGSSGSPICDDAWTVAALHYGARSISDQNIEIRGKKIKRENVGTPIPTILAFLEQQHPEIHQQIEAGQG